MALSGRHSPFPPFQSVWLSHALVEEGTGWMTRSFRMPGTAELSVLRRGAFELAGTAAAFLFRERVTGCGVRSCCGARESTGERLLASHSVRELDGVFSKSLEKPMALDGSTKIPAAVRVRDRATYRLSNVMRPSFGGLGLSSRTTASNGIPCIL